MEKRRGGGGRVLCNEVNEAASTHRRYRAVFRSFEAAYKALISGRSDGKSGQMSMVKALLNFSLPPTIPKLPPTPSLSSTMGLSSSGLSHRGNRFPFPDRSN